MPCGARGGRNKIKIEKSSSTMTVGTGKIRMSKSRTKGAYNLGREAGKVTPRSNIKSHVL